MKLRKLILAAWAIAGLQGCYLHAVGLDLDHDPTTGCSLHVHDANVDGTIDGIEVIALTGVFSTSGMSGFDPNDVSYIPGVGELDPNDVAFDPNNPPPFVVFGTFYGKCGAGDSTDLVDFIPRFWPVGLNNGTDGADVVEYSIPRELLEGATQIRATFLASTIFDFDTDTASQIAEAWDKVASGEIPHHTDVAPGTLRGFLIDLEPGTQAPAMSLVGLAGLVLVLMVVARRRLSGSARGFASAALIVSLVGIAYAATIVVDGQVGDWSGIQALGTDPEGDSSTYDDAEDILAVFATADSQNLYLRVDIKDIESGYFGLP